MNGRDERLGSICQRNFLLDQRLDVTPQYGSDTGLIKLKLVAQRYFNQARLH